MNRYAIFYPLLLLFITLFLYVLLAGRLKFDFPTHPANYFSHLAYSLLNGRIDLINPSWDHDLSIFKGKLYMYWGPTPVLLILPAVILFGIDFSDALYTAIFGSFSPVLTYFLLSQMTKKGILHLSDVRKFLLCLFFSFGTTHFAVAVNGGVWFTSQTISTLYMISALSLIFIYLNEAKLMYLVTSSFLLGLAIWGRSSFIFYLPIFMTIIYLSCLNSTNRLRIFAQRLFYPSIILIFLFVLSGIYNFQRFNSFFENGYSYHNYAAKFSSSKFYYGVINFAYIPHNFYYMFVNTPAITSEFPFLKFDPEGNSFLLLSPLFFLIVLIIKKQYWSDKLNLINSSIVFAILSITFFQLVFWGTGWLQFGYRYSLDIVPLLIILLAEVISGVSIKLIIILSCLSVVFNTLGTVWFLNIVL